MAFPLSHVVVSFVFCLLPWAALLDSWLSYYRVCVCHVHIVFGVCLADPFSFSCCNSCPFDALGGATASPSVCILPTRSLSCPQGSRLSAVIGLCRSLWRPLAAAAEVADSSASKSVCLRTRRSAPGQVCGLALLARLTCPHLDGRPPTAVGRVSSLRGVAQYLVPRKNPTGIFGDNIIYIYIYIYMYLCMYVCMYVCIHYLAMTVITPRLPALALYRKPSLY